MTAAGAVLAVVEILVQPLTDRVHRTWRDVLRDQILHQNPLDKTEKLM